MDFFRRNPEHNIADEKRKLEKTLARAESQIKHLEKSYNDAETQIRSIQTKNSITLEKIARDHSKELSDSQKRFRNFEQKSSILLQDTINKYDETIKHINTRNLENMERLQITHQHEVDRLKSQLITPADETQGWPDDKLLLHFKELQRQIDSMTSPTNKTFVLKPGQQVPSILDPFHFCERNGVQKFDFLLKSIIWHILRDQLFSLPFGFGVLGQGEGQKALLKLFYTWRELHFGEKEPEIVNVIDFECLCRDKFVIKWRCATFQCFQESLKRPTSGKISKLAKFSLENHNMTVDRILQILGRILSLGNDNNLVTQEIEDKVNQIAYTAQQIALQFGTHSTQLQLEFPNHGDEVIIGKECHDCEDGDSDPGKKVRVDLTVVPSLQKVGDGRADTTTRRTIAPSEIYPYLVS